jgi:hypothetical protein
MKNRTRHGQGRIRVLKLYSHAMQQSPDYCFTIIVPNQKSAPVT